jgi:hypothetical protein
MKKDWHGIMKILELQHIDTHGNVISTQRNLLNLLHQEGEEFLLRAAFVGGRVSNVIPEFYYLGLDNRQVVADKDTIDDLIGEPLGGGYERQAISSDGDFAINLEQDHFLATSPIVAFRATTSSWGPVSNLFLTNTSDTSGSLISTVILASPISLNSGDSVTMRIGMQLRECTTVTTAQSSSSSQSSSLTMIKKSKKNW